MLKNGNSLQKRGIKLRKNEMTLRKNEMTLRKNEMELRRNLPFLPWRISISWVESQESRDVADKAPDDS